MEGLKLKKLSIVILLLVVFCPIFPTIANADVGPKPTLKINAKNMPNTTCYLDLLVNYPPKRVQQNITDFQKYKPKILNKLKQYNVNGWRPALVTGTMPPLFGDILCDIKDGECINEFSYLGVPDQFKIIVVSEDGKIVISNEIRRIAFNSEVYFDYRTGKATEKSPINAYIFQFISTCTLTLIIEVIILLIFGFNLGQNWKPFIAINFLTQILLTLIVFSAMYKEGTLLAMILYVPFELVIVIIEAFLFAKYLKQHSQKRRVIFSITANIASFIAGILLMLD